MFGSYGLRMQPEMVYGACHDTRPVLCVKVVDQISDQASNKWRKSEGVAGSEPHSGVP
jgi:hypothetical protein